jgi:hypothetical protein
MVLHMLMIAAFSFILRGLRVSVVKNYAKQSQLSRAWKETPCGVTTSGVDGGHGLPSGWGYCAKQSQFHSRRGDCFVAVLLLMT